MQVRKNQMNLKNLAAWDKYSMVISFYPSNPDSDERFAESIRKLGSSYLPIGLGYAKQTAAFRWEEGPAYERFRSDYLRKPVEVGRGRPFHATRALMQYDLFQQAAFNSGHISAYSDPDGVYRHLLMLLKVEEVYFPTLSLSMFLDYVRVPFEKMIVRWGESILIPALKGSFLEWDVVIPIDDAGRAFIPFAAGWDEGFKKMGADTLLKNMQDESLRGNLTDFFKGRFVLVGDISVGISDLGNIPLESDAPLIILHASMLNGMSVLFSDLAGFTTISEKMTPAQLVHLLNQYLTEMTDIVLAHGGIIDKYEGDAIMAEFGAPLPLPDHADRAVMAGLRMQKRLKELREIWKAQGLPELRCRVGINTGPMIVGNMGSNQVFDYTVIGDAVNLASRLEGANKRYDTYLMISEFTLEHLTPGVFRTRTLDVIKVEGKSKAVKVFEVYGENSEPAASLDERYYSVYHDAFELYLSKEFDAARKGFQEALSLRPHDPAAKDMLQRMDGIDPNLLPPDWDGSIALTSK